ncbi:MAG: nucleoside hydrolase [Saprospiraceae bacterium]|nr:nucleoside hydrolase [Saprospiraceae bacterium]
MRHFLIDTDTASDDAVALVMALMDPKIQVEAITLVAGNVPLDQGLQNALYTLELCGKQIPTYAGAAQPLLRELHTAQFVHGTDGMGDIGLPLQGRTPTPGNAIDVIIDTIKAFPNEIELVTLGPLTNIALALAKAPEIAPLVKQCTIMGGVGKGRGNITPVSEFNIWVDPEAAKIVFDSGMKMKMVGWDISRNHACIDLELCEEIKAIGTPLAEFSMDIQNIVKNFSSTITKLPGFDLPDPIAMAIALDESVATETAYLYVEVIIADGLTRGQTVVDHVNVTQKAPNMEVVFEASRAKFLSMLKAAVK